MVRIIFYYSVAYDYSFITLLTGDSCNLVKLEWISIININMFFNRNSILLNQAIFSIREINLRRTRGCKFSALSHKYRHKSKWNRYDIHISYVLWLSLRILNETGAIRWVCLLFCSFWMHPPSLCLCPPLWAEFLVSAGKEVSVKSEQQTFRWRRERILTCWTAAVWFLNLLLSFFKIHFVLFFFLRAWAFRMTDTLLPNGIKDGGGDNTYFKKVSLVSRHKNTA